MSNTRSTAAAKSRPRGHNTGLVRPKEGIIDPVFDSLAGTSNTVGSVFESPNRDYPMDPSLWASEFTRRGPGPTDLPAAFVQASANLSLRKANASTSRTTSSESTGKTSQTSSKTSLPSTKSASTEGGRRDRKSKPKTPQRTRTTGQRNAPPKRRQKSWSASLPEEEEYEDGDEQEGLDEEPDENSRRSKFLERNRIAASRCRQKKKKWVNNLEETKSDLESQNSSLQKEYYGLVDQVSRMKNQLMSHASCNDSNINQWIENEARNFVQKTARRMSLTQDPSHGHQFGTPYGQSSSK